MPIDHDDLEPRLYRYKQNTCGFSRRMNPTTLTHPTTDSKLGYSTVLSQNFYSRHNYNLL